MDPEYIDCKLDISQFICPLSHEIFYNPVFAEDGHVYEKQLIKTWLTNDSTSPITRNEIVDNSLP